MQKSTIEKKGIFNVSPWIIIIIYYLRNYHPPYLLSAAMQTALPRT
jgi:hypothetical protein